MNKGVNIKKLAKYWGKMRTETIKICVKHLDCKECPFCMVVEGDNYCHLGRFNAAIEKLKGTPNYVLCRADLERGDDNE